jgi:DNA-binding PadR family transcriptional regulator
MANIFRPSPLALAVLALLYEAPMHPYRMQQLIKARGKDRVINVQRRASLYQTIRQLLQQGLIEVHSTRRQENRPERTIYSLTEKGLQEAKTWLRKILSTPSLEFPEFPAAISFLPLLTQEDALRQLEAREQALAQDLAERKSVYEQASAHLLRLFLLEDELVIATQEAELKWVRGLIADLRSGVIHWDEADLRQYKASEDSD